MNVLFVCIMDIIQFILKAIQKIEASGGSPKVGPGPNSRYDPQFEKRCI